MHLRKFTIIKARFLSSGVRYRKARNVINNWYIPKLELSPECHPSIRDNGAAIQWSADPTERCHITEIKEPSDLTNNQAYESQICRHLDRRKDVGSLTLPLPFAKPMMMFCPNNMPHIGLEDGGDDGGPNDSDDEPEGCISHCVTTKARHLRTVAPVSGNCSKNA